MTLNIWTIVLSLEVRNNGKNIPLKYITDLQGFSSNNMLLAFTLLGCLFSMSGVPPLAGFFVKIKTLGHLFSTKKP